MASTPIKINTNKCDVYFVRHAQSESNISNNWKGIDAPLTSVGIEQSKALSGHYTTIFCSPLRRALETLHYSSITYDKLKVTPHIQEFRGGLNSITLTEYLESKNLGNSPTFVKETDKSFWARVFAFHRLLEDECAKLSKECITHPSILIISHGYFFNGWYYRGCHPCPLNAKITCLVKVKVG